MAQVTEAGQAVILDLIRQSVKIHHEIVMARLMSNDVHSSSTALQMALHSAHIGSDIGRMQAAFCLGELAILVPSRDRDFRQMAADLLNS
jgi:hypothetical protein